MGKNLFTYLVLVLVLGGVALPSYAAIPRVQSGFKKQGKYIDHGVFTGGETGKGFSLLNLRRKLSKRTKRDRWIIDLGDVYAKPLKGQVPYFHIAVTDKPARVVIDLFQVHQSKLTEQQLAEILKQSPYVKATSMIYDPVEGGINLTINMKHSVLLEAFQMPSKKKPNRLVLDIKPNRKR